jgi:two-component system, NarL family, response regulator
MESTTEKIRVLLADDHPIMSKGVAMLLECQPDISVVGQAQNGREAIALYQQHQPDISLMDLRMPEVTGLEAIIAIRAEFPHAKIIVVTTYDGDEDIYRALQAGAKGYLLKGSQLDDLLAAIRTVHRDQSFIPPQVSAKLAQRIAMPELSDRELDVLQRMAKGKNNPEISADLNIAESTVRFHINNILSKLGVSDRTQAVITAVNRGIVRL